MAFGKDPSQLGDIGTFRQTAKQHQAARPKGGGGGAKPYFLDGFKPSTDDPDKVRLIKGHYEVEVGKKEDNTDRYYVEKQVLFYFPYIEHYFNTTKKGFICSAGPFAAFKAKRNPCLGCDRFFSDKSQGIKNGPMGRREMYAFTVLHYAQYAKIDQIDRATGVTRTDSNGKAYQEWTRMLPHERNHPKFAGKEVRDAQILHWDVGFGHWNTLIQYDKEIGRSCRACGGRDTIQMEAWTCRGCGEALIEAATTTFSPKEIDDLTGAPVRCASCGHVGLLKEYVSCSGCSNAERAEIFDVDISVKRIADPNGGNQTTLAITSWSNPGPIDARFTELAAKPLDLAKIFAPTPIEKQQELIGGAGARTPVTAGQHSKPYGEAPTLGGNGPKY